MRWLLRNKKFQNAARELIQNLDEEYPKFRRLLDEHYKLHCVLYKDEVLVVNSNEDEFIRIKPSFERNYPREAFHGNGFDIEWHCMDRDC